LDTLATELEETADAVEQLLDSLIVLPEGREARVVEAMRYSTFAGGKRLRPFLVIASADLFAVRREQSLRVAAAVEMVHTYSLVHDDLPCMDDDDLRRGKPSAHIQFDEATAVLAGDGLLTQAFEVLADEKTSHHAGIRTELVLSLARAAGSHGMVGGQMMDLLTEHIEVDVGEITRLQQLKTGALIAFACEAGAILGKADDHERHALHAFAHDLGLAFQITDDLLDAEGSAERLGKKVGKDKDRGKATYVSLLGLDGAHQQAKLLAEQAATHLAPFGPRAELLRDLAIFVINRGT
jgi:farnesyl diphosphate synthase